MLHGPCGLARPDRPCTKAGVCQAGYPKMWLPETVYTQMAYPEYARPNDGLSVNKGGDLFDNRDVVPYSPVLLRALDAHCNVEAVTFTGVIKYLYKYCNKVCFAGFAFMVTF